MASLILVKRPFLGFLSFSLTVCDFSTTGFSFLTVEVLEGLGLTLVDSSFFFLSTFLDSSTFFVLPKSFFFIKSNRPISYHSLKYIKNNIMLL